MYDRGSGGHRSYHSPGLFPYTLLKDLLNELILRVGSHPRKEELSPEAKDSFEKTLKQINVNILSVCWVMTPLSYGICFT